MTDRHATAPDDPDRLDALRSYEILDTAKDPAFDDIAQVAQHVCGTSMAVVSLVDAGRQWFKAEIGFGIHETSLDLSICSHAIRYRDQLVIPDLSIDPEFCNHPAVIGRPYLRFYAGAPLRTADGHALGTLCVADTVPRRLGQKQIDMLRALARQVMTLLELRKANIVQGRAVLAREREAALQAAVVDQLQHRFKNNLQTIDSLLSLQSNREATPQGRDAIARLRDRLRPLYLIQDLVSPDGQTTVELSGYLHDVTQAVVELHRGRGQRAEVDEELTTTQISREKALPLGLIVNEFLTNSFRHAFGSAGGKLTVHLSNESDERACLTLADDGPGFTRGTKPASGGLGVVLIDALSGQAGGRPQWETSAGARLTLSFAKG